SAFAAATFNLGPAMSTLAHTEPSIWRGAGAPITALGVFDPRRGAPITITTPIIQFPPGSTILIPSAILRHSNVGIAEGERRYSFTQYSAAGLFRWVHNGHR
ncbi:hypothetical protein B0H14DRAFT_2292555, partial [Mycena olivaceomarginata]